ncbi:hypothetical protein B0A55_05671 [Friedmanniomyces simplex]|uniref:RING-type domain-containing protein n=1 Tax=Friedmanniomyces simplex TaxID=329884 RepID=A0A4U0XHJ8_9PEZI|nr:hypothetical protein B0A55_05671 [Friedmanniomyces simplex]
MLDVEDRYCAVCKEDYDSEIQPLALHNSSHLICNQCLLTWCREQGPEVCCPHELFTDEATLAWLKFGVQDKTYEYDDRYDAWKNYTRSCADLDKHLALNNPTEITVHRDIALSAWDDIIAHELLESPESTPYHLHPARSPEYNLLRAAIENSLDSLNGTSGLTLIFYHALQKDLCQALARASLRGGVALGLSAVSRRELLQDPIGIGRTDGPGGFGEYGLMPGFMEFAKRSLSRMLQFLSLRVCHCGEGAGQAFHQHGLRKYYNLGEPEEEKEEVEKVTAELGKSSLAEDEEGPCEAWASSMTL